MHLGPLSTSPSSAQLKTSKEVLFLESVYPRVCDTTQITVVEDAKKRLEISCNEQIWAPKKKQTGVLQRKSNGQ